MVGYFVAQNLAVAPSLHILAGKLVQICHLCEELTNFDQLTCRDMVVKDPRLKVLRF